jgi:hypothetical protein
VSQLLLQDRATEAIAAIDSFIARWDYGASLFLINAPTFEALMPSAATVARADSARWGARYERLPHTNRLWYLGGYEVAAGDLATAAHIHAELERRARASGNPRDALFAR